jgi:hypothetical protein
MLRNLSCAPRGRRQDAWVLLLGGVLSASGVQAGAPPFLAETVLASGNRLLNAENLDVGLFAGDGRTDLLAIQTDPGGRRFAAIWEQVDAGPTGAFVERQILLMPGNVVDVIPTDLERDGDEDVIVLTDDPDDALGIFVRQPAGAPGAPFQRNPQRFSLPPMARLGRIETGTGPGFEFRILAVASGTGESRLFRPDGAGGLVEMAQRFAHPGGARAVRPLRANADADQDFLLLGATPQRLWLSGPGGYTEQLVTGIDLAVEKVMSFNQDLSGDAVDDLVVIGQDGRVSLHVTAGPGQYDTTPHFIGAADAPAASDVMLFDINGAGTLGLLIARPGGGGVDGALDVHLREGAVGFGALQQRFTGPYAALQFGQAGSGDPFTTAFVGLRDQRGLQTFRVGAGGGVSTITVSDENKLNPRMVELGTRSLFLNGNDTGFTVSTMFLELTLRANPPVSRRVEVPITDNINRVSPPRQSVAVFEAGAATAVWRSNVQIEWRDNPTIQIGPLNEPDVLVGTPSFSFSLPRSDYYQVRQFASACVACKTYVMTSYTLPSGEVFQIPREVACDAGSRLPQFPDIGGIAAVSAKSEATEQLEILRQLRDRVLLGTSKGQDYVSHYYTYSDDVTRAMVQRPGFLLDVVATKDTVWPFLESMATGDGSVVLTQPMVDAVIRLADASGPLVSAELRALIAAELAALDLPGQVGKSAAEVRAAFEALPGRVILRTGFEASAAP